MVKFSDMGFKNFGWVGAIEIGRFTIRLASIATFSRLLSPADYGLMAMAITVTVAASIVSDVGIGNVVIQIKDLSQELLSTLFYLNFVVGLIIGAVVLLSSHAVALAFGEARVESVLAFLAISFPLTALGAVHQALMERELRFRSVARIELCSLIVSFCVALLAALKGFGVYTLVVQNLLMLGLNALLAWQGCSWRPSMKWSGVELRKIWRLSVNLSSFNLANYIHRNLDNILIGRFLGAMELGLYTIAYSIMLLPLQILTFSINRALLPVYSRQDHAELRAYYSKMLAILALIGAPVIFGLWSVRTPLVQVALSAKWLPVSPILAWLFPVAFIQCFVSTTVPILIARGRSDVLRNLGFLFVPLWVVAFVAGLPFGVVGVAAAYFFATLIGIFPSFYFTLREIGLRGDDLISAVWRPTMIGVFMAALVTSADVWFVPENFQPWPRLVILCFMGVVVYVALVRILASTLIAEVKVYLWKCS